MSDIFHFRQFSVRQDRCAMKVGTDGVLLGALAVVNKFESLRFNVESLKFNDQTTKRPNDQTTKRPNDQTTKRPNDQTTKRPNVLDIGTGTGLIALMIAQRSSEARIVGVDINADAAAQAAENFAASPWGDRLTAVCADVRECMQPPPHPSPYAGNPFRLPQRGPRRERECPPLGGDGRGAVQFDHIVCNPPYYEHSPGAASASRNVARRTDTLSHEELARTASRLLCDEGVFEVIIPYSSADEFIHTCWLHNLYLSRRIDIRTKPGKPCKRSVLAFTNSSTCQLVKSSTLQLYNTDGTPTNEYRAITADFLY